jgi:hypothetical protein
LQKKVNFYGFIITIKLILMGHRGQRINLKPLSKIDAEVLPWWRGLVVSSTPATKKTGAMGLEIESRQVKGW